MSSEDTVRLPTLSDQYGLEQVPAGLHWIEINELKVQKDRKLLRVLIPQYPVNDQLENVNYRIDFALFWPRTDGKGDIRIAIECDGHDFHEKTKEQAQRDKKKDRYLQRQGWIVARYTGSEIDKDPLAILIDVEKLALSKDEQLFRDSQK